MTCETALDRMLEAEPAALQGRGPTDLAAHIAGCERCARTAAALLAELEAVDAALDGYARSGDDAATAADAALAASRGRAQASTRAGASRSASGRGVPVRGPWWSRAWVPLAAAAALAAVLILARGDRPGPVSEPAPAGGRMVDPRVAVTPPPDRGAAIMETANPNITIVWLYEREDS